MNLEFNQTVAKKELEANTQKAKDTFKTLGLKPTILKGEFGTQFAIILEVETTKEKYDLPIFLVVNDREWPVLLLHPNTKMAKLTPNPEDEVGDFTQANYFRINQIQALIEKQVVESTIDKIISVKVGKVPNAVNGVWRRQYNYTYL